MEYVLLIFIILFELLQILIFKHKKIPNESGFFYYFIKIIFLQSYEYFFDYQLK